MICLNIRKQGLSKLSCSYFVKFEVCYVIIFPVLQFKMLYSFVPCSSIFSMRVRCFKLNSDVSDVKKGCFYHKKYNVFSITFIFTWYLLRRQVLISISTIVCFVVLYN